MKKSYNGSKTIKIVNRGLKNGQKMYGVKDLSHIFTGVVLVIMNDSGVSVHSRVRIFF